MPDYEDTKGRGINKFWAAVLTVVIVLVIIKWLIPAVSRELTGLPFPLTVPGTLQFIYIILTLIALFLFLTFSDEYMQEFWQPIARLLRGEYGNLVRNLVLLVLPILFGWWIVDLNMPKLEPPIALRIQHPSSNFPKKFEAQKNPFATPTNAEVQLFVERAKSGDVVFIPQLLPDIEAWKDMQEDPEQNLLAAINSKEINKFLIQLSSDAIETDTARKALVEKYLFEGRALYAMNCRPCHGDSVSGDGPMADGFKLRPINFTDIGTLETIVEGYTFWRVANGGTGLPTEATPWDSAMPEWKLNLTENERWLIILAEYDLAEKTPRILESH